MLPAHRAILRKNYIQFRNNLQVNDELLAQLYTDSVFGTPEEKNSIRYTKTGEERGATEKAELLVDYLPRAGKDAFQCFRSALAASLSASNRDLADTLKLDAEQPHQPSRPFPESSSATVALETGTGAPTNAALGLGPGRTEVMSEVRLSSGVPCSETSDGRLTQAVDESGQSQRLAISPTSCQQLVPEDIAEVLCHLSTEDMNSVRQFLRSLPSAQQAVSPSTASTSAKQVEGFNCDGSYPCPATQQHSAPVTPPATTPAYHKKISDWSCPVRAITNLEEIARLLSTTLQFANRWTFARCLLHPAGIMDCQTAVIEFLKQQKAENYDIGGEVSVKNVLGVLLFARKENYAFTVQNVLDALREAQPASDSQFQGFFREATVLTR